MRHWRPIHLDTAKHLVLDLDDIARVEKVVLSK